MVDERDEALHHRRGRPAVNRAGLLAPAGTASLTCLMLAGYLLTPPDLAPTITPPYSDAGTELMPTSMITVGADGVLVDSERIGDADDPEMVARLERRLRDRRVTFRGEYAEGLLLLADEDTPYGVVSTLVHTANEVGFTDVRLVTRAAQ